jgi:hypothetical protein
LNRGQIKLARNKRKSQPLDAMYRSPNSGTTLNHSRGTLLSPIEEQLSSSDSFLSPTCVSYSTNEDFRLETATVSLQPRNHSVHPGPSIKRKGTLSQSVRSLYDLMKEKNVPDAVPTPPQTLHSSRAHQFVWTERFHKMYVPSSILWMIRLTHRDGQTSQWGPMMYRGRPKNSPSCKPGPPGESVEEFFNRILSKADEEYASVFDPSMECETSVRSDDNKLTPSSPCNPTLSNLESLVDGRPLSDHYNSLVRAVHTQPPGTWTPENPFPCRGPSPFSSDDMDDQAMRKFAFGIASQHPDAMRPSSRHATGETDLSTHRTLPTYIADQYISAVSWCKEKSQAFGRTKDRSTVGLASGSSKRNHSVFGRNLSRVGVRIQKEWKKHCQSHISLVPSGMSVA